MRLPSCLHTACLHTACLHAACLHSDRLHSDRLCSDRFCTARLIAACLAALLVVCPAAGQVIISEIMYNPDSYEGGIGKDGDPNQTEWIEVYNAGDQEVSLSGWYLQDEDGQTEALPASAKIGPGEAVVLIPGVQSVGDFREAWGKGFQVFKLDGWAKGDNPLANLANSPSDTNEVLTLRNADGDIIDTVNYDDESDWPGDSPDGPSITLKPDALDPDKNDQGSSWVRSEPGKFDAANANKTEEYSAEDVGSPGRVATE